MSSLPSFWRLASERHLRVALVAVASLCALPGCGLLPRPPGVARLPQGTPATRAKFLQIQRGMTPAQVEAIFGSPGHTSKGSSRANPPFLSWLNEDASGAIIMFENGRVNQRMQVGTLK